MLCCWSTKEEKYVDQLDPQSSAGQQTTQNKMSSEDKWRCQWNSKPVEDLWSSLQKGKSASLLKKHLTEDRYKALKDKPTSLGGTLAQCMSSGALHEGSKVGIYACDPSAYADPGYAELFNLVIQDYHTGNPNGTVKHPEPTFGTDAEIASLGDLDPSGQFVVSTRVRMARSHEGMPFPPAAKKEHFEKMEKLACEGLSTLTGNLSGTYYPLRGMDKGMQQKMIEDHFLFRADDDVLGDAGGYSCWDTGRGIFHNKDKTFLTWLNEEDHFRFISMQMGGNLGEVYKRLVDAIRHMETKMKFAKKDGLGYLTFCPTNLGTTLRASVHVRVPMLSKDPKVLKDICDKYKLQPRGVHGEHSESKGGVYDISNKQRLGLTEYEAVKTMKDGVLAIIAEEAKLTWMPKPIGELWDILQKGNSQSLMKKFLTPVYEKLKDKKTTLGGTIAHCINSGCLHEGSKVGIYACDPDAYTTFEEVFNPVILAYHKVDKINHPEPTFGTEDEMSKLENIDPENKMVLSTRIRVARSHTKYPFSPACSSEDFENMEADTVAALSTLSGELAGQYYPLAKMTPEQQNQLIQDHFLFRNDDDVLGDAGGYKYWDIGRGIFHNKDKTFLTWVNEEDHLRLISMQKGGDLGQVYRRLVKAIGELEKKLTFAKRKGYGYLTFCPSNLGTTLRASVHMAIPNVCKQPNFKEFCEKFSIQPRGIHGEHSESEGGVYDLSNKRRLGLTEYAAVREMLDGVLAIKKWEEELAAAKK
ncbi:taurocyamine kinase-like isoform X2 [Mya arenaria]|uniref:taurocyamine kinase-like isoform X2 n=1 Tax=Mya arenaria TaxID=6604 RepID=UPI0022E0D2E8|nr:taurocyamine kinase-like isoform X2 [Mya arenaria]